MGLTVIVAVIESVRIVDLFRGANECVEVIRI